MLLAVMFGCGSGSGTDTSTILAGGGTGTGGGTSPGGTGTISWTQPVDPGSNPFSEVSGYKIYYGVTSGNYIASIDVGNLYSVNVTDLNIVPGDYYMAVTAYDSQGRESGLSNEVSKTAQ